MRKTDESTERALDIVIFNIGSGKVTSLKEVAKQLDITPYRARKLRDVIAARYPGVPYYMVFGHAGRRLTYSLSAFYDVKWDWITEKTNEETKP